MSITKSRRSAATSVAAAAVDRAAGQPTSATEIAALKRRIDALVEQEELFEAALSEWVLPYPEDADRD